MKRFKYSVEDLINGVRVRPMLWDKTLEVYKDKVERRQAWMEICGSLEQDFDEMSSEDRRIVMDIVTNKWTNMRDTFTKSIRTQTSRSGTKPYQYQNEMAFLLKIMPQGQTITFTADKDASDDNDVTDEVPVTNYIFSLKKEDFLGASEKDAISSSSYLKEKKRSRKSTRSSMYEEESTDQEPSRKKRLKKREAEASDSEAEAPALDYGAVNESDPRIMNEDEAFFASLLPTVVRYSEDERLEFRIQVLAVMKSISNQCRNKWTDESIV